MAESEQRCETSPAAEIMSLEGRKSDRGVSSQELAVGELLVEDLA